MDSNKLLSRARETMRRKRTHFQTVNPEAVGEDGRERDWCRLGRVLRFRIRAFPTLRVADSTVEETTIAWDFWFVAHLFLP